MRTSSIAFTAIFLTASVVFGLWLAMWSIEKLAGASDAEDPTPPPLNAAQIKVISAIGTAGIGLAVASVFGGGIATLFKLLLSDYEARREERARHRVLEAERHDARQAYLRAVLDDIKSVYDTVEQARLLIEAHESALTYGNEMRKFPQAIVTLHNVRRALLPTEGALHAQLNPSLSAATTFMKEMLAEFREAYIDASRLQTRFEALKEKCIAEIKETGESDIDISQNPAWDFLEKLPELRILRDDSQFDHYERRFKNHIDAASFVVRRELAGKTDTPGEERARSVIAESRAFSIALEDAGNRGQVASRRIAALKASLAQ